jgi:protein-S-isoprenylcysteine O-methyltransferase Ste14
MYKCDNTVNMWAEEQKFLTRCDNRCDMLVNGASASVKEGSVSVNVRMLLAEFIGLFVAFALAMFIPAGTLRWVAGWGFLFLFFGFVAIVMLMSLVYIFFIPWLAIMPLDAVQFQLSHMPVWIQLAGALILIGSFYLFYLVIRENPHLSPAIRVQEVRGQRVVSTGPYHYIRHPYYVASILFFPATTLMLGSWYGLIPELVLTALVVIRAVLEEKALQKELKGYDIYMKQVKYRFIPHIW